MALKRGRYGIEYNPLPRPNPASGLGRVVLALLLLAGISLAMTLVRRYRTRADEQALVESSRIKAQASQPSRPSELAPPPAPRKAVTSTVTSSRSAALLLRLKQVEKTGDLEMQITTLESLLALPPTEFRNDDGALLRRLGELNRCWLFERRNPRWVEKVKVERGETATLIARNHGSTLASLARLNEGLDINRLKIGSKIYVLNHPKFALKLTSGARNASLFLNGRYFCSYRLVSPVASPAKAMTIGEKSLRQIFTHMGMEFSPVDRSELELLMPTGATVEVVEAAH